MCARSSPSPSFFDPSKARGPKRGPDVGDDDRPADDEQDNEQDEQADVQRGGQSGGKLFPPPGGKDAPLTVSALLRRVKGVLTDAFPKRISVVGEISNFKAHASGHLYFRLKDADATIDAVMFRSAAAKVKFQPADGLEVIADVRVDVYEVRGQLQLYVERMTPRGAGALELAFRQLCEKLRGQGLFDPARKKPLRRFPRAIGVITSPTGAAVRDIGRTLLRRWPAAKVYLLPALVQGEGAAEQIAQAIGLIDAAAERLGIDTIIVARGGGSLEDLWAFNEEVVARAVFTAATPIISGVGHETDVTICDLAADVRAATPTAAAELAVPDGAEVRRQLARTSDRLERSLRDDLAAARTALEGVLRSVAFRDPAWRVRTQTQRIDELSHRLRAGQGEALRRSRGRLEPTAHRLTALHPALLAQRAGARLDKLTDALRWVLGTRSKRAGDRLAALRSRLAAGHPRNRLYLARQQVLAAARQLDAMSYRSVLKRGYSVTRSAIGVILKSASQVAGGEKIETELADGKIASVVTGGKPPPPPPPKGKPRNAKGAGQPTLFGET